MLALLSRKVLPVLQLTRMALVFTAIADGLCTLMLAHRGRAFPWWQAVAMSGVSVGLYGFGMSLNDIIDRRRDGLLASNRPLPSGRLNMTTAHLICALFLIAALICGAAYCLLAGIWSPMNMLLCTIALIAFYDGAGKYLVWPGLIALGLIRFSHAIIPAPSIPLIWHPLLLLNHVVILSTVAYMWEEKRPVLTRTHVSMMGAGLLLTDLVLIASPGARTAQTTGAWMSRLEVTPSLIAPIIAVIAFVGIAVWVRKMSPSPRDAGQRLMLYGLLWLIVYDAAFVGGFVGWASAGAILLLLPIAYASVRLLRWWGKIVAIAQRPPYRRA